MKLTLLVGTMSDTAWQVAQAMEMAAADHVAEIEVRRLDASDSPKLFQAGPDHAYIVCTSTFGSGDLPDNAQPLYHALDAQPRYLGGVRYGVVALGDSGFGETFARGGRLFDERLADLGAIRVGELLVIDACSADDAEEAASAWIESWLEALQQLPADV